MTDELKRFHPVGLSWAERASAGELHAVLSPTGTERRNRFLHTTQAFAANWAATLPLRGGRVVDFGCGTGRFLRRFHAKGFSVLGTEITPEMIAEARRFGIPEGVQVELTDGIHIPSDNDSVDLIWVCGVLRFSLLVPDPVYAEIAREMYRVLKPGGHVVNAEIYVDTPPRTFIKDFEDTGFKTKDVRLFNWHFESLEQWFQKERRPLWLAILGAQLTARYRCWFGNPDTPKNGLRDYIFIWQKPGP